MNAQRISLSCNRSPSLPVPMPFVPALLLGQVLLDFIIALYFTIAPDMSACGVNHRLLLAWVTISNWFPLQINATNVIYTGGPILFLLNHHLFSQFCSPHALLSLPILRLLYFIQYPFPCHRRWLILIPSEIPLLAPVHYFKLAKTLFVPLSSASVCYCSLPIRPSAGYSLTGLEVCRNYKIFALHWSQEPSRRRLLQDSYGH